MSTQTGCTFADVVAARRNVLKYLSRTPLHSYGDLNELLGASVFIKHENHHAVGAFKVRGGVNLAADLIAKGKRAPLYTASTGNHGQSIAFAGKVTGLPVRVALPKGANPAKAAAIGHLGAELIYHGTDFDEAREWIRGEAEKDGAHFIGPTEPLLIAGVGTYTMEIMEELPDVEVIIVPVGAGSGASSAALVAKSIKPGVRVIAVQAEKAPAIHNSWRAGEPVAAEMKTAADGLATRVAFENTLNMLLDKRTGIDDFLLVSDEAMETAVRLYLEHARTHAELAGGAPLAAALQIKSELAGKTVALALSGGNLAMDALCRLLADRG